MDDYRLPKTILNYKPEGRRNIGRPLTRWEDDFWEEGTGLSLIDDDDKIFKIPGLLKILGLGIKSW